MIKSCKYCGEGFKTFPCRVRRGEAIFCGRDCVTKSRSGRHVRADGYIKINTVNGWRYEHIVVAEKTIGRRIGPGEIVHHKNQDPSDNRASNLIVFKNQGDHRREHSRMRILSLGGVPGKDSFCPTCSKIKPLGDFSPSSSRGRKVISSRCKNCSKLVARIKRANAS